MLEDNEKPGTRDKWIARLLDFGDATANDPHSILYQHSVFRHTGLPYRNPGDDVRQWERANGAISLHFGSNPHQGSAL